MLEKLGYKGSRIFDTCLSDDKVTLELSEACDGYFTASLTKAEVLELAADLCEIASNMAETAQQKE
jgi:hypothetical protein